MTTNATLDVLTMLQLLEKDGNKWHMLIHEKECMFTPMVLYVGNNLYPEKPNSDRGLRWRVNRKWVSYNQIKALISEHQRHT